jgi:Tfp pilus assembly protein PilV
MHSARQRSNSATAGTSLLEALGALGLTGVAMLGLVGSTVFVSRVNTSSSGIAAATALAQQKLEQLRSMPLDAAGLGPGQYTDPAGAMKADGSAGGPFSRSWVVSAGNTPRPGLKTVTVSVAWVDSRSHTTTLAAYVRCSTIPCS